MKFKPTELTAMIVTLQDEWAKCRINQQAAVKDNDPGRAEYWERRGDEWAGILRQLDAELERQKKNIFSSPSK